MTQPSKQYAARREYFLRRYAERKALAFQMLGGVCARCGTSDNLQIDHIDPKTKSYNFDEVYFRRLETFEQEMAKRQLLCGRHHTEKTLADNGRVSAKGTHGTTSSYRYCHCDLCRAAARAIGRKNSANYRARQRARGQVVKASVL